MNIESRAPAGGAFWDEMLGELCQVKTKDGLPLEGLFFSPSRKTRTCALWIGGLGSRFSSSPERTHALALALARRGIAFAIWNSRGFGTVVGVAKAGKRKNGKRVLIGTCFEKFEDSVLDIAALARFLRKRGCRKIFLLGHSTGANKAAYYIWKTGGRGLAGAALLGPLNDVLILKKSLGGKYGRALRVATRMAKGGRGGELMPRRLVGGAFWSARRFLSIARAGGREDAFPYYDPRKKFYWAGRARFPIFVAIGAKDKYADRPVSEILGSFRRQIPAKFFSGAALGGADHGFAGKEKELARTIANWIARAR